jgi:GNAT superfamily N-acetyltransferase
MTFQLTTRPFLQQDRLEWEALWKGYNAFYGRQGDTALPDEIVETSWGRLMADAGPVHGLVAVADDRLVGLAHFIFHPNMILIEDTCYLQDLFTADDCRGRGVARQLIEAVCETCRARGVTSVYWHTHSSNTSARALYDKVARDTGFLVYRAQV